MTVTLSMPEGGKDWLKLAGGVAAGIGTVAALPIFGPIGTVTALGAVLGGLAGASLQLIEGDEPSPAPTTATPPSNDTLPQIRQNLFAAVHTAADYDRAIGLLHTVAAWAVAKCDDSTLLGQVRRRLDSLLGDGLSPELCDSIEATYAAPPDAEQLQKHLQQAFAEGIDRDHFLAAALGTLLWLAQDMNLPLTDLPQV